MSEVARSVAQERINTAYPLQDVTNRRTGVNIVLMQLRLPELVEAKLSPASAALHLAIGLFVSEEATLGQAAEIAGLPQADFLRELGQRRIPIHYGVEELTEDLRTVESLTRQ